MQQAARVSDMHGVLLPGPAGRDRPHRSDLHRAGRKADRGLHHRPVRLGRSRVERRRPALPGRARDAAGAAARHGRASPRSAVREAVAALSTRDAALVERVLDGDEPINDLHIEVDDRCLKLLALHQPMATDLRRIVADGEDQHRPGARRRPGGATSPRRPSATCCTRRCKPLIDIPRMGDIAQRMLRDALDAFVRRDMALAEAVLAADDELDALKSQIFRELLTYMMQDGSTIEPALDLILVVAAPRADRRPRHQRRRGRDLPGLGARRPPPRPGGRRNTPDRPAVRAWSHARTQHGTRPPFAKIGRAPAAARGACRRMGRMEPRALCAMCRLRPVEPRWRPFCSQRCQQEDLARWADGSYRVPGPADRVRDRDDDEDDN